MMRSLRFRRCGQATRSGAALAVALTALVWIPSAGALSVTAIAPANNAHITLGDEFVFTWSGDVKGCGKVLDKINAGVYVEDDHGARFAVGFMLAWGSHPGGRAETSSDVAVLYARGGVLRWRLHAECNSASGAVIDAYSGFRTLYFDKPGTKPNECTATVGGLTHNATANGKPLHPGDSVAAGSLLVTGAGGILWLNLPDGGRLSLGAGSTGGWESSCKPAGGGDTVRMKFGKLTVSRVVERHMTVLTRNASVKPALAKSRRKTQSVAVGISQESAFAVFYDPKLRATREHTFVEAAVVRNNAGKEVTVPAGFCSSVVGNSAPTTPRRCH